MKKESGAKRWDNQHDKCKKVESNVRHNDNGCSEKKKKLSEECAGTLGIFRMVF